MSSQTSNTLTKTRKQAGQVYFDYPDYIFIKNVAKQRNQSFAEFMREAGLKAAKEKIENLEKPKSWTDIPKFDLADSGGPHDLSQNIDDYLYGDKSKFAR